MILGSYEKRFLCDLKHLYQQPLVQQSDATYLHGVLISSFAPKQCEPDRTTGDSLALQADLAQAHEALRKYHEDCQGEVEHGVSVQGELKQVSELSETSKADNEVNDSSEPQLSGLSEKYVNKLIA